MTTGRRRGLGAPARPSFGFLSAFSTEQRQALAEGFRRKLPPNWPVDVELDRVITVVQDDGIPLVWVPREEIVTEVLSVADRSARTDVLLEHVDQLVDDCRAVLDGIPAGPLDDQTHLALRALDALQEGHVEAAQALAVLVTETAVSRTLGRKYPVVKKQVFFDKTVTFGALRLRAALAPIGPFYQPWWPRSGQVPPSSLSRHVSVHQADRTHYTKANGVIAVLLATSVLRGLQEFSELVAAARKRRGQQQDSSLGVRSSDS